MLDVGWTELVVIAIVLIVVVGPKDLPPMLRTFGKMMSKMRGMASDFRHQFDEALKEADLDDVRRTISDAQKLNPAHSLREAMNPLRQMGNDIKADLQKATRVEAKPDVPPDTDIQAAAVASIQPLSAPLPPSVAATPVTPVVSGDLGGVAPLAPAAPIAMPLSVAAVSEIAPQKTRKPKLAKAAVEAGAEVVAKPRKKTAKTVAGIEADAPRKRKAADKTSDESKTGDDA